MEIEPFENPWIKKIRLLTKILIVSLGCNIILATSLITSKMSGHHVFDHKKTSVAKTLKLQPSNGEVVKNFFLCSFGELTTYLANDELLQDGYTKRDLALSCLVAFHHFDIERAVVGKHLQRRKLSFVHVDGGEQFDLEVYPGLDETDFMLIQNFIKREKWPLTTEGLFEELKKEKDDVLLTSSLAQSFVSTSEFYTLYTLFRRKSDNVKASEVLQMLLEGPWKFFEEFTTEQKASPDLTQESMRNLLTKYVRCNIPSASLLWIKLDSDHVLHGLDDSLLKEVVEPIEENSTVTTIFLKQLLCSVRSDELREIAGRKLYAFENLTPPEPYDNNLALVKFLPAMFAKERKDEPVKEMTQERFMHTVKEGESLWKIAKKYRISIADIRKCNRLKSDKLRPGQKIEIPKKG